MPSSRRDGLTPDQVRIGKAINAWLESLDARQDQVTRMSTRKLAELLLAMVREIREEKKS